MNTAVGSRPKRDAAFRSRPKRDAVMSELDGVLRLSFIFANSVVAQASMAYDAFALLLQLANNVVPLSCSVARF